MSNGMIVKRVPDLKLSFYLMLSAREAVQCWYDEIKDYNYRSQTISMNTGKRHLVSIKQGLLCHHGCTHRPVFHNRS